MIRKTSIIKIDWDFKSNILTTKYSKLLIDILNKGEYSNDYGIHDIIVKETYKGFHIKVLLMNEIYELEAIAIATICGSDINREMHNIDRLINMEETHNFLASAKKEYVVTDKGVIVVYESEESTTLRSTTIETMLLNGVR